VADEEENVNEETTDAPEEAPAEEAPAADEAPAAEETPAEEETETPSAGSDPSPPEPEDTGGGGGGSEPTDDAAPEEVLTPKEARKRSRSTHSGEAGPERSGEERATQRVETRRGNAAARSRRRSQERAKRGETGQGTPPAEPEPGVRKSQLGTVVSDKADKTITVRVDIVRRHRRYEKVVRQSATVHAHDEQNEASAGDTVRVIESRPMSRLKRWRLVEVVEKAR